MRNVPLTISTASARCEELQARQGAYATMAPDELEALAAELEEISEYMRGHAAELAVYLRRRHLRVVER